MHEQLDRSEEVKGSSDRNFGLTFAAVGTVIALWPLTHGESPRWWWLAAAAALTIVSLTVPHVLHSLNRAWLRIGLLLNRIVSPIVLGIVFYGVLAPLGLASRAAGKDPLQLRFDNSASSYWIARDPPGPAPKSMIRLF
jgi:predicted membrane metal-binding protein